MFEEIPPRVWLLIAVAAAAFAPVRYLYSHITHSPNRRDITLPPEDLSWRSQGRFVRNLAILLGLGAFAAFIFTPAATKFARSPIFLPILMAGIGAFAFFSVAMGFSRGRIQPLVRGLSSTYERETQPKRFWASLSWNAVVGCTAVWAAFIMIAEGDRERCYDRGKAYTPQEELSACNALIGRKSSSKEDEADVLAARGYAYHRLGDYRRALADYSRAISLDPSDSYSLYNRGLIYQDIGDLRHAVSDYDASLKLRPDNAEGYLNRGLIFLDVGQFDKAIVDFTQAHEGNPRDPWPLADRGIAYAWKGDRERATKDFEEVRKIDPANPVLLRGEALLDINEGNLQSAIAFLTEALRNDPKDAWSLKMRADVYWRLGQHDKARDDDDRLEKLREDARKLRNKAT